MATLASRPALYSFSSRARKRLELTIFSGVQYSRRRPAGGGMGMQGAGNSLHPMLKKQYVGTYKSYILP
jgi:hypothetical protein